MEGKGKSNVLWGPVKLVCKKRMLSIHNRMEKLYGKENAGLLLERLYFMLGRYGVDGGEAGGGGSRWDGKDVVLVTYPDQVKKKGEPPLKTLGRFCQEHLSGLVSTVHILPFFPWSSDDGFSVMDYREVDRDYGSWDDIRQIGDNFGLMFDLVLNHCSAQGRWFRDYLVGIEPARHYFIEMSPGMDLSAVVRPRTTPLLTEALTREGRSFIWTTFGADQVDLDWKNPDVLFEFLDILLFYISQGCKVVRLDAVAFLWKKPGSNCLHLEETHEVVKLLRDFIEIVAPGVVLLTETNVPNEENISYFGDGRDEAHMVYQFALPPLLLHGLLNGTSEHLRQWAGSLPELSPGCTFLNFTASHDGIGLRPLQDILGEEEITVLVESIEERGGKVSYRAMEDGSESPYELNITYLSALDEPDNPGMGELRFLCSQALALSLQGVPAIYFQSLVGAENDIHGLNATGRHRSINRQKWSESRLKKRLGSPRNRQSAIFQKIRHFLEIRAAEPAFHPSAGQQVLDFGNRVFAVLRQSSNPNSSVLCLYNFTSSKQALPPMENNAATDLLTGDVCPEGGPTMLLPYQALWLRYTI